MLLKNINIQSVHFINFLTKSNELTHFVSVGNRVGYRDLIPQKLQFSIHWIALTTVYAWALQVYLILWTGLCSDERAHTPAIVLVIGGGYQTFVAACEAIEANIPVFVFAGSGKAADFIAAAYDSHRREQPLVLQTLHTIYVLRFVVWSVLQSQYKYSTTRNKSNTWALLR